jgi:xanthine dehydrogenase YagT iron-sulfur-binding subunit
VAAATALHAQGTALAQDQRPQVLRGTQSIVLNVNGKDHNVQVETSATLLDVLRNQLDLTGAKPVSMDGSSGASTVIVDGKPATASTILALAARGKKIQTVESLTKDAVPAAFVEHDAMQCGFCTPGFVVAVRAFLNQNPNASEEQIRSGLNGNVCRCGTYAGVLEAAIQVAKGG